MLQEERCVEDFTGFNLEGILLSRCRIGGFLFVERVRGTHTGAHYQEE
jgi:hypothetical protein